MVVAVHGRKLVFLGGGDGNCNAFETLTRIPKDPVILKTVWWVDCNPQAYRAFGGMDVIEHYTLGDKRRRDTINKPNDGSFIGMSEIIATPVFNKNRVYVAIGRAPDQGLDRSISTVSIYDGLLYIVDVAGRLHCLGVETGDVQWVYESNSRTLASTLVADGKIYLSTEKHLHILAAGREMKRLSQIRLGTRAWATPVAANGTLCVVSRNYLWAVRQQDAGK
ncbi:MAG: PQQ-binding-like beta-propeller repeat protein [Planctomycetes bacterium]|nr:PQQ-binding-like beta-propeller repeat protein [Planctomycetota bacterium]